MPRLRHLTGDANILEQSARGALRAQAGQDAQLQATDHRALAVLGNHELDVRIARDTFECIEIG